MSQRVKTLYVGINNRYVDPTLSVLPSALAGVTDIVASLARPSGFA